MDDLLTRLRATATCRRCNCLSCGREGCGELHDHVCTGGPDCVDAADKLRAEVGRLRRLCREAAAALEDHTRGPSVQPDTPTPEERADDVARGLLLPMGGYSIAAVRVADAIRSAEEAAYARGLVAGVARANAAHDLAYANGMKAALNAIYGAGNMWTDAQAKAAEKLLRGIAQREDAARAAIRETDHADR